MYFMQCFVVVCVYAVCSQFDRPLLFLSNRILGTGRVGRVWIMVLEDQICFLGQPHGIRFVDEFSSCVIYGIPNFILFSFNSLSG